MVRAFSVDTEALLSVNDWQPGVHLVVRMEERPTMDVIVSVESARAFGQQLLEAADEAMHRAAAVQALRTEAFSFDVPQIRQFLRRLSDALEHPTPETPEPPPIPPAPSKLVN